MWCDVGKYISKPTDVASCLLAWWWQASPPKNGSALLVVSLCRYLETKSTRDQTVVPCSVRIQVIVLIASVQEEQNARDSICRV